MFAATSPIQTMMAVHQPAPQVQQAPTIHQKFTEEEDNRLRNLVSLFGAKKWTRLAAMMPGRSARQCRDRYSNYLAPGFIQHEWTTQEDDILFEKFKEFGSQWTRLREFFPGRTANSIKNRWNYSVSRRLTLLNVNNNSSSNNNFITNTISNKVNTSIVNNNNSNSMSSSNFSSSCSESDAENEFDKENINKCNGNGAQDSSNDESTSEEYSSLDFFENGNWQLDQFVNEEQFDELELFSF